MEKESGDEIEYYLGKPVIPSFMVPGKGRKEQLDRLKDKYPSLRSKPGFVIVRPVFESQQAMAKLRAKNATVFKELDKIISSVRADNASAGTKAAAAAPPDQAKAAAPPEGKAEAIGGYAVNPEDDLGEPSSKYQKI